MKRTKAEMLRGIECVKSRLVMPNTVKYWKGDGTEVTRFHFTDIITKHPDYSITLDTGGWKTPTTKQRLNEFSDPTTLTDFTISQRDSIWYINVMGKEYLFKDGMTIDPEGGVTGVPITDLKDLNKKILKYVNGFVTALFSRRIPKPSGADCWFCHFVSKDGKSMGDLGDNDHILSHIEENYYVPSLLLNAIGEKPISNWGRQIMGYLLKYTDTKPYDIGSDWSKHEIRHSLKCYLRKRVGLAC